MRKRHLLWQLCPSLLLVTVASVLAVAWYSTHALHALVVDITKTGLTKRAMLLESEVAPFIAAGDWTRLNAVIKDLGGRIDTRITVVLPSGHVVADSAENSATMENHGARPELAAALAGEPAAGRRTSATLGVDMVYAAAPVRVDGQIVAAVRAAVPTIAVDRAVRSIHGQLLRGLLLVIVLTVGISLLVTRRLTLILDDLCRGAQRFARGDLDHRIATPATVEFRALADALNGMADELNARIQTISRQRNELEAVLASMEEGVLAVDKDERLISLNESAARVLGIVSEASHGRLMQEVIRNTDLQRFLQQTLSSQLPVTGEVDLPGESERHLHAHGTPLRDAAGRVIGAVVVMHDVTQLRQLERIRRDFVANVSHELKTPITSIKGFVETLQDGAIENEKDAKRFLGIIAKQADRLNAIIEDLLSLSRIEQENDPSGIALQPHPLRAVVRSAVEACQVQARGKNVTIETVCDEYLTGRINAPLLEQAVVNLIDNSIKYSESGTTVRVEVATDHDEIAIAVKDEGCGIERRHISRIFERFYRVDKARSSKLGGTGLGLAIVKHIAQTHGGYVSVDSQPGRGSTFVVHLPRQ